MHQQTQGNAGPTVYVMVDNEQKDTTLSTKAGTALSIVQITLGITSIVCQVIIIISVHIHPYCAPNEQWDDIYIHDFSVTKYTNCYYPSTIGEGIFCGIFFFIAGMIGLLANRKPSTCKISAFMTLSIIASIFSAFLIFLSSSYIHSVVERLSIGSPIHNPELNITMLSIMLLSSLIEGVVAIICASICCRACCCTAGGSKGGVVYMAQGQDGPGATPVQMAYLHQPIPATEALDQKMIEIPLNGEVVKEEEVARKEKYAGGGYRRLDDSKINSF